MSPDITDFSGSEVGKTLAVGFLDTELCDNSLASFPSEDNFSWGELSFWADGCDSDNYVEAKILDENNEILKSFKYTSNGRKELDLSQYPEIPSTQDIHVRIEITTYI